MFEHTLHFTSNTTAELVRIALRRAFPDVAFDVTIDVPAPPFQLSQYLTALIVRWDSGPDRDEVEEIVAEFQSLEWNPVSGVLELVEHMEVSERGSLQRVQYGIDYVLCDGPGSSTGKENVI